jgi:ADP-ribose pyrophosphatase YjhB (NUDIX family)
MRRKPLINVAVIIHNENKNKILLGKGRNHWNLVQSGLHLNENFETCAKRCLYEQVGLRVDSQMLKFLCTFNAVDKEKSFHSVEIYYLLELDEKLEKFIFNKYKFFIENWVWIDFGELSEMENDLFTGFRIFLKKFKISSYDNIKSIQSN